MVANTAVVYGAMCMDETGASGQLLAANASGDVVILGAGFSKSVNLNFPITDELGRSALIKAGIESPERFAGGNFEAWLSFLAEDQPFLTQSENLANRAMFSRLVDAIHKVLCSVEHGVASAGWPGWLYEFVATLHARRATVLTFNYDRLIERSLDDLSLADFSTAGAESVQWHAPLNQVPSYPPVPSRWSGELASTFRLCKLHGSLNWYWVPGDATGATLHHWELEDDPVGRERYLPGREPFLVPPTSGKSAFFRNPIMSETWRRAHQALRAASRVVLIGYSLPLTDLTIAGMIADSLSRDGVSLDIVNLHPGAVEESLKYLTGKSAGQSEQVEDFVRDYVRLASVDLAERCRTSNETPSDTRVVVGWNTSLLGRPTNVSRAENGVVLDLAPFDAHPTAVKWANDGSSDESLLAMPLRRIASALRPGDTLEARFPGGETAPLVGIDWFRTETGASTNWQVLIPASHPSGVGVEKLFTQP